MATHYPDSLAGRRRRQSELSQGGVKSPVVACLALGLSIVLTGCIGSYGVSGGYGGVGGSLGFSPAGSSVGVGVSGSNLGARAHLSGLSGALDGRGAAPTGARRTEVSSLPAHLVPPGPLEGWYASSFFGGDPELDAGPPERTGKWGGVLAETGPIECPGPACPDERWRAVVDQGRSMELADRIKLVNDFIRQFPYRDDPAHAWGGDDWSSPARFNRERAGDCKDFAIAQYYLLRAMGTPVDRLRITRIEEQPINHVVLAVAFPNRIAVLDYDGIWTPARYGPLHSSMNENRMWAHVDPFHGR